MGLTLSPFGREGLILYGGDQMSINGRDIRATLTETIEDIQAIGAAIDDKGVSTDNVPVRQWPSLIESIGTGQAVMDGYFHDIYLAITSRGGVCVENDYSTYDEGVLSIQCDDTVLLLQGYLEDVYNAILIRGGHCTHLDYSTYDTGVLSINTSSSMAYLQSCLADIYDAIIDKGSTCDQSDYSTYAQGIENIETSSGEIAELEAQIAALQAQVASLQSQISTKDATISSLQSQVSTLTSQVSSLQGTITTYQSDFSDIASAITTMGGTVVDSSAYGDYDTYVLSIPSGSGQVSTLEGYLADVYTAISNNTVGVTCTSGNYSDYDDAIGRIYTAYNGQISTLNGTITTYVADFADIATAITTKGGTVTSASAYSDFDTYVLSIPNQTVQGGDLDRIKSQIYSIGAIEQNARSINSSFTNVPLIRVTDGSNLFADMPNFEAVDMYLDMSACTDCTDMFKNSPKVPVITILNFGNNSNADLVLDLALRDDFDLSYMAGDIKKYTTSPDGTKHVRKFLVTQGAYNLNNDWGAIETLRNKGITVEVKQTS